MHGLRSDDIVRAWEATAGQTPAHAAIVLLGVAQVPGLIEEMTVSVRDAALLAVRERTFGPLLTCYAECPSCSEPLEFTVDSRRLAAVSETAELWAEGVRFRRPNAGDLAAIASSENVDAARRRLIERILLDPGALSSELADAIESKLEEADGASEVSLDLRCPACEGLWQATLDIAAFFAAEVAALARRLLIEVHTLASAYGWPEQEILSMSATRRRCYLDLVGA